MEFFSSLSGNVLFLLAVFGAAAASVSIAYLGLLWMTSSGDPQKVVQVRLGVIGAVGGLVLVGVSFVVPRVVFDEVIAPSGGVSIGWDFGLVSSCDHILRDRLVSGRSVSTAGRINSLVSEVQADREGCSSDVWGPVAWDVSAVSAVGDVGDVGTAHKKACFGGMDGVSVSRWSVGDSVVPAGLRLQGDIHKHPRNGSGRDADNNIIVYWSPGTVDTVAVKKTLLVDFDDDEESLGADEEYSYETYVIKGLVPGTAFPSDSSKCWLYVSRLGVWSENY